jgi:hypothetical protein
MLTKMGKEHDMKIDPSWEDKHRPSGDPDYDRMVEATRIIEGESLGDKAKESLNRRFDYNVAMQYGKKRGTEIISSVRRAWKEDSDQVGTFRVLAAAWPEGFIFGCLAYSREKRGRESEAFLDRVSLADVNHFLNHMDEAGRTVVFEKALSRETMTFVSTIRSMRALQIAEAMRTEFGLENLQELAPLVDGHWLDGFHLGVVFQELGGHREGGGKNRA